MSDTGIPNDRLRQARRNRGWTQAQLAKELNVGVSTVRSWESGSRSPSLPYRTRICVLFQMTPEELGFVPHQDGREADQPGGENEAENNGQVALAPQEAVAPVIARNSHRDENRSRMLNRVQSRWITGFLDLMPTASLIQLHLKMRPDAVASLWRVKNQEPYAVLASGIVRAQQICDLYDEADGEVLILGEPGAGKTTLLLELTRELLARCRRDTALPIPVVFHLSGWARRMASFEMWLAEELNLKYQVPLKVAQMWN